MAGLAGDGGLISLSGGPGSGKTHMLRALEEVCRARGIKPLLAATTGAAATHIWPQAKTMHSAFGFPRSHHWDAPIAHTHSAYRPLRAAQIIAIDERA